MMIDCSKVYVKESDIQGLGVFTNVDLKEGEIIEKGLMYRLKNVDGNENPHLFTWSDDKSIWAGASGCIPWYNHSDTPNVKKVGDLKNDKMTIIALKSIKKDEELCNKYFSVSWRKCFQNIAPPKKEA
jgi:SET domain-containing protein